MTSLFQSQKTPKVRVMLVSFVRMQELMHACAFYIIGTGSFIASD